MDRPEDVNSLIWEQVEKKEKGRICCKFCGHQFAGGITRIKYHFSGRTGNDVKVCEKVPQYVQLKAIEALDTFNKKERQVKISKRKRRDGQVGNENYLVPSSSGEPNRCEDNVLMCKKLGKLFYSFGIHPTVILSPIFEDFVKKSIVGNGPSTYQLASTFTGEEEFESEVEGEVDKYIKNFKNVSVQDGYSLMVNIWEFVYDEEVVVCVDIFAYSEKGVACFGSHKHQQRLGGLRKFISSMIDMNLPYPPYPDLHFGPNFPVVQLLLSYSALQSALRKGSYNEFSKIRTDYNRRMCVSHCPAFEIDAIFLKMELGLDLVIALSCFIFNTYQHYKGEKTERPKEKYAFILVMLKKVLEIEKELKGVTFSSIIEASDSLKVDEKERAERIKFLESVDEVEGEFSRRTSAEELVKKVEEKKKAKHFIRGKFFDYIIGSKEFLSRVEAAEPVWSLLFQTRCLVNCEHSSIGYLYQMIERLEDGIRKSREYDHFVYDHIWEPFIEMRDKIIHPIHATAALFDPAYMRTKNFVEKQEMMDGTIYMSQYMVALDEKEAFEKGLGQYREELPKLNIAQKFHPRTWWAQRGEDTQDALVLKKYAIRILAQPCSTSLCKRYEMPLGNLSEDWTTKMNTMIINRNSKILELEPIIFDKIVEDHDAFKDVMELDYECYMKELLLDKCSDADVDCIKNYPSPPFWDDVYEIFGLFDQPYYPSDY